MAHRWGTSTRHETLPKDWRSRRLRILRRDRWLCQIRFEGYCTVKATDVDHKNDRLDHSPANLQASCSACNQRKNQLTMVRPKRLTAKRVGEPHPGLIE